MALVEAPPLLVGGPPGVEGVMPGALVFSGPPVGPVAFRSRGCSYPSRGVSVAPVGAPWSACADEAGAREGALRP